MSANPAGSGSAIQHADPVLRCSFCGKSQDEVDDLVAGPTVFICGECIDRAHDIVVAARARRAKEKTI